MLEDLEWGSAGVFSLSVSPRVDLRGNGQQLRLSGQLNLVTGRYIKDLGNTPGHVNHWSKRGFVQLLERYGTVEEARSPFPWTMLLVRAR